MFNFKACLSVMLFFLLTACAGGKTVQQADLIGKVRPGMPPIDPAVAIYELPVNEGLTYQDVVDSLKSVSQEMNFVNPAHFSIGEQMQKRGIDPQGIKEVHAFCNLSLGTEIMLDHPEFSVFAPCRIAIYEKPDANKKMRLYLALARPTFDLISIKNPSQRAKKSAQELETSLLELIDRARKGDF